MLKILLLNIIKKKKSTNIKKNKIKSVIYSQMKFCIAI